MGAADPTRTIPLVDELIDKDKVFAQITLGSGPTMKTYDKLNQRGIPQPSAPTGFAAGFRLAIPVSEDT